MQYFSSTWLSVLRCHKSTGLLSSENRAKLTTNVFPLFLHLLKVLTKWRKKSCKWLNVLKVHIVVQRCLMDLNLFGPNRLCFTLQVSERVMIYSITYFCQTQLDHAVYSFPLQPAFLIITDSFWITYISIINMFHNSCQKISVFVFCRDTSCFILLSLLLFHVCGLFFLCMW